MRKIIVIGLILFILIGSISVNAFAIKIENNKSDYTLSKVEKEWTYMLYVGGDDIDWGFEPVQLLTDMLANLSVPILLNRNVEIVFLLDFGRAFLGHFKRIGPLRAKMETIEEYEEINFGNYTTLRDFIIRCKTDYPAKRYFLHMHGHGRAWYGANDDDIPGEGDIEYDQLTMNEVHQALEESGGVDILQFTNCNMASFESAYELRNCTEIYIASEEGSAGFTPFIAVFNNMRILNRHFYRSTPVIAKKMVNYFKISHPYRFTPYMLMMGMLISLKNRQQFKLSDYNYYHFTMSAVRTDKLDEVCEAINDLSEMFIANLGEYKDLITVARLQANDFPDFIYPISKLVDIYHFADLLDTYVYEEFSPQLHTAIQNLKNSLDESVIANWVQIGHKDAYGLSLFFPYSHNYSGYSGYIPSSKWSMQNYTTLNLDFVDDTHWDEFLEKYLDS